MQTSLSSKVKETKTLNNLHDHIRLRQVQEPQAGQIQTSWGSKGYTAIGAVHGPVHLHLIGELQKGEMQTSLSSKVEETKTLDNLDDPIHLHPFRSHKLIL